MTTSPDYHSVTSHQINQFNILTEIRVGSRFVSNQKIKGKVGSTISIIGKQLLPESNTRVYNISLFVIRFALLMNCRLLPSAFRCSGWNVFQYVRLKGGNG